MKFGISQIKKPTPKSIKRIALACVAAAAYIGGDAYLDKFETWKAIASGLGLIAAIISPLFGDNENSK